MTRLLTQIAIVAVTCIILGWWGYNSFEDWKTALIEQGKTECRSAVNTASNKKLLDENARLLAEVQAANLRASAAEKLAGERKEEAKAQHEELNVADAERQKAATTTCPAPMLPDRAVSVYNAPIAKAASVPPKEKPIK